MSTRSSAAWGGAACGIAAGFAAWAFLVRLDVPFHYGTSDAHSDVIRRACFEAGQLWLACTVIGALLAGTLGAVLRPVVLTRDAPLAATAVYVLALRGARLSTLSTPLLFVLGVALLVSSAVVARAILRGVRDQAADRGTVALHLALSLTATHLVVQLPYYVALAPAFYAGLLEFSFAIPLR